MDWEFRIKDAISLYGDKAVPGDLDFANKKEASEFVESRFRDLACPECGKKDVQIVGLIAEAQSVQMYKYVTKKGFFGSKEVEELERTMFRILGYDLRQGGFFGGAGHFKCSNREPGLGKYHPNVGKCLGRIKTKISRAKLSACRHGIP